MPRPHRRSRSRRPPGAPVTTIRIIIGIGIVKDHAAASVALCGAVICCPLWRAALDSVVAVALVFIAKIGVLGRLRDERVVSLAGGTTTFESKGCLLECLLECLLVIPFPNVRVRIRRLRSAASNDLDNALAFDERLEVVQHLVARDARRCRHRVPRNNTRLSLVRTNPSTLDSRAFLTLIPNSPEWEAWATTHELLRSTSR